MTITESEAAYDDISKRVFGSKVNTFKRWNNDEKVAFANGAYMYDGDKLISAVEELVAKHLPAQGVLMRNPDPTACKVYVHAIRLPRLTSFLLTSGMLTVFCLGCVCPSKPRVFETGTMQSICGATAEMRYITPMRAGQYRRWHAPRRQHQFIFKLTCVTKSSTLTAGCGLIVLFSSTYTSISNSMKLQPLTTTYIG